MQLIIKLYDYLREHVVLLWTSLLALTVLLACLVISLGYNEDISDFLPLDTSDREALDVYQNISGANRLYLLFSNPDDADLTVEAIDFFAETVHQNDSLGWCDELTTQFDMAQIQDMTDFVYDNIPYFLTDADYSRIDSLLSEPDYLVAQLERDKEMLLLPTGSFLASSLARDPLSLFSPVLQSLQRSNYQTSFEMYDGYIFTPDMSRAVAMMNSPFGNSETEQNSVLLSLLNDAIQQMEDQYPGVKAHVVGGPEIAVGNASRIKTDSIIAIALSSILIVLLLVYSFGSLRNILLILLSIGWGWLFALGGMALFSSHVSIIVIGLSSVILGIAVNYPLHLIAHTAHEPRIRVAIKDIMAPLVVGNITTVGAFLALVPLQSTALRDLGLFASLLLIGTIVFVLLYLPHFIKIKNVEERKSKVLERIARFSPERYKSMVIGVVLLTLVLSVFSLGTEFDSNIANMNYMTDDQREDMQYFQQLLSKDSLRSTQSVYVLASGENFDEALCAHSAQMPVIDSLARQGLIRSYSDISQFLVSKEEQEHRLEMWNAFTSCHQETLTAGLSTAAVVCGFAPDAFTSFEETITNETDYYPQDIEYFTPLTQFIFSQNITKLSNNQRPYVVNVLNVEQADLEQVKSHFENCFDVVSMNSALSNNLSDNFNYIGWACSLIVFFFLWFSFGRIELAIISFLPMAISWVWILGIMTLLGIKFNIVNVILATFIFGQGDDYTIFMTEGCQHEYIYRRPILESYKGSILQSALIMFIGIGTLIVAKHPAMHSLAEVTIIGMSSVVLMAYMIPPLLFRWLTTKDGQIRRHPLTLSSIFGSHKQLDPIAQVQGRYIYKGIEIYRSVNRQLHVRSDELLHLDICSYSTYTITDEGYGETAILLALTHPDVRIVAHMPDDERRRVAEISAQDFVDNIEFIA